MDAPWIWVNTWMTFTSVAEPRLEHMTATSENHWWYGYKIKPNGTVCISDPFSDPAKAKAERDQLRTSDIAVTSRFRAGNKEDALKTARTLFRE